MPDRRTDTVAKLARVIVCVQLAAAVVALGCLVGCLLAGIYILAYAAPTIGAILIVGGIVTADPLVVIVGAVLLALSGSFYFEYFVKHRDLPTATELLTRVFRYE